MSVRYDRIENNNYDLNIDIGTAERDGELIAVADNECLRAIRRITNHAYTRNGRTKLKDLVNRKKELSKDKDNNNSRVEIKEINNEIRELLYIKDYVCVNFPSGITQKKYNNLNKNGFKINGIKYKWLLCGAGHQRTNRAFYCNEEIFTKLWDILNCGAKNVEIVPAKFNAYFALSSSASNYVSEPRVCVVPDCEIKMTKKVDWVSADENGNYNIEETDKELNFNLFDGMGIISPEQANKWATELKLDYIPSCWCIRSTYIKGMVCVIDFHKFSKEIANKHTTIDIWGNEIDTDDVDIILTQSQFKLWNAYESWEDYRTKHNECKLSWGVAKITPKVDDDYTMMNYQYLQVLDIDDKDVEKLCEETVQWFRGVCDKDNYSYKVLYLLGKMVDKKDSGEIWNDLQDNAIKSLLLDKNLMYDSYINERIYESIKKKIKESRMGKIIVRGNYQTRISDPYGLMQHIYGMEVTGLLKENEDYMWYWNNLGVKKVVAMRSPLTWRSEAHTLNLVSNDEMNEWYKYLNSGIVYNLWGCDDMLEADADYDMDCTCTTNNEIFLKGVTDRTIPITYQTVKPQKEKISHRRLEQVSFWGFDTKIGQITNQSTSMYILQAKFNKDSREYQELDTRLKLFRYFQGNEIDRAKNGYKAKTVPKHWVKYTSDGDSEFNNSLVIDKKPYFMRYLYAKYDKDYKNFIEDFDRYSMIVYGKSFNNLSEHEGQELKDYYNYKNPLLEIDGVMNKLCRYMESQTKDLKSSVKNYDSEKLFNELYNEDITLDQNKLNLLLNKYVEYSQFKLSKQSTENDFADYEQYYKYLRNQCLEEISSNIQELANLSVYLCYRLYPKKKKDFCWNVFGYGILENIKLKNNSANIPVKFELGNIDYLGRKYFMFSKDIDSQDTEYDCDNLFEEFDSDDNI